MSQPSYCCPTTRMSSHKQVVKSHSSYVRNSKIKWKRRVVEINWVSAEKTLHTSFSVWQEALKKNQIRKAHASIMAKSLNQNAFYKLICVAFLPIHALLYTAQVPPLLSWQHQWLLLWFHTPCSETNQQQHATPAGCRDLPKVMVEHCKPSSTVSSYQESSSAALHFIHSKSFQIIHLLAFHFCSIHSVWFTSRLQLRGKKPLHWHDHGCDKPRQEMGRNRPALRFPSSSHVLLPEKLQHETASGTWDFLVVSTEIIQKSATTIFSQPCPYFLI